MICDISRHMNKLVLIIGIFTLIITSSCNYKTIQDYTISYNILLDGASFASSENNNWFEYLCSDLRIKGYNKAISGSSIKDMAQRLHDGTLFSLEEMDNFGILMIMHVHNMDVCNGINICTDLNDYDFSNINLSYSQAYDYVIREYQKECYDLKNNRNSRWYKSPYGKPCIIVCLTHWHDARDTFNTSIRLLQNKFNFYLCELDKNIGFSKDDVNTENCIQPSLLYCSDTESINGVHYGWHMDNTEIGGKRCLIQDKVASIVKQLIKEIYFIDSNYSFH